jgi:hypothetical protein
MTRRLRYSRNVYATKAVDAVLAASVLEDIGPKV